MRLLAAVLAFLPVVVLAQISPARTYYGVNRPIPVNVMPAKGLAGPFKIQLLEAVTARLLAEATVKPGQVDLAKAFPDLWRKKDPKVLYAQLVSGERKVGPALVLQPMLNPTLSKLKEDGKTIEFVPDEDGALYNGIRAYVDKHIVFDTSEGPIEFRLRPDAAPNTAWTIRSLVEGGFYTDVIFHRIVAKRPDGSPFVIQGGDPTGTGSGGPGFAYALEESSLPHDFGVISIARSTDPNTNGSQIFIGLSRAGTQHLDGKYAAFGEAVRGGDAILAIAAIPVGERDRPNNPPRILSAKLVHAPPYGTGPAPLKRP